MKSSPKRKFSGPIFHLNYVIQEEANKKLRVMVGDGHIGIFMEELILREYRRREKRAEEQLYEAVCDSSVSARRKVR